MNEAMRNLAVLLWAVCAINTNSYASDKLTIGEEAASSQPTIIYGVSNTAPGKKESVTVEQPAGAANPLGNPIVDTTNSVENNHQGNAAETVEPSQMDNSGLQKIEGQVSPQGEMEPGQIALPQNNQIQNEIYQDKDDIIDVQAFPIDDLSKVTEPNLQPAIINTPENE